MFRFIKQLACAVRDTVSQLYLMLHEVGKKRDAPINCQQSVARPSVVLCPEPSLIFSMHLWCSLCLDAIVKWSLWKSLFHLCPGQRSHCKSLWRYDAAHQRGNTRPHLHGLETASCLSTDKPISRNVITYLALAKMWTDACKHKHKQIYTLIWCRSTSTLYIPHLQRKDRGCRGPTIAA